MNEIKEKIGKWQPLMVVIRGDEKRRLECECGNLAIFACFEYHDGDLENLEYWFQCQDCFEKSQEEEENG